MTQEKLSKMIVILFESKLKSYKPRTVKIWVEILEKFPDDKLNHAFTKMIYSDEEFPSVGKIIKMCQPDYKQIAEDVWTFIMKQVRAGKYEFDGAIKDVLQQIGGARQLGIDNPYGLESKKRQFVSKYRKEIEKPLLRINE